MQNLKLISLLESVAQFIEKMKMDCSILSDAKNKFLDVKKHLWDTEHSPFTEAEEGKKIAKYYHSNIKWLFLLDPHFQDQDLSDDEFDPICDLRVAVVNIKRIYKQKKKIQFWWR